MDNSLTLLKFSANWCMPCKALAPVLEEVLLGFDNVSLSNVNVDEDTDTAVKYGVRSIPTLVLLKGNEKVGSLVGLRSAEELKAFLSNHS